MADPETSAKFKDIREEVENRLIHWASRNDRPEYPAQDLVAMALTHEARPLTVEQVMRWVVARFPYYRDLVAHAFWHLGRSSRDDRTNEALHLRSDINRALLSIELPVKLLSINKKTHFAMTAAGGMIVLGSSPAREPQLDRSKSFFFFELPGELRSYIYDLVFAYPKSGLELRLNLERQGPQLDPVMKVHSNNYKTEYCAADAIQLCGVDVRGCLRHTQVLSTRPIRAILAPLLVCRQFYREAVHVFYEKNLFFCPNLYTLYGFLRSVHPDRVGYIRQLAFLYRRHDTGSAVKAFQELASLKNLHRLEVHIDEEGWLHNRGSWQPDRTATSMNGIGTLRRVKADVVNFTGYPTLETDLRRRMARVPAPTKKKANPSTNKRKAQETSQGVRKSRRLAKADPT